MGHQPAEGEEVKVAFVLVPFEAGWHGVIVARGVGGSVSHVCAMRPTHPR